MLSLFKTQIHDTYVNISLLVLRLGIGALMLTHGWPKLLRLASCSEITFPDPLGIGSMASLIMATLAEAVGSLMIMLGLGTRFASVSLIFTMIVAVFIVHADDPFARKELGLLYLLVYVVLLLMGSGKFSIDKYINDRYM